MDPAGHGALITGGASGLGLATAKALAARGCRVVILDLARSNGEAEAKALKGKFVAADVTSESEVAEAVEAVDDLRILVNCAGIGPSHRIVGREGPHPLDAYKRVIEVNLVGTFNVLRLAATRMAETEPVEGERGVIVNTASVAAFEGQVGQAAYSSSKAGIVGLTIVAARDLATLMIRVCTIAPGIFDTPLLGTLSEEFRQSLGAAVPHPRRLGSPDEYAALAVHIVENQMLNGETIRLDGAIRMPPR
ncbi:MAG TPA: 3-hydroxyacyl-CoA dehydrogenase [Candidatus Dormibacteraeota bacterium]